LHHQRHEDRVGERQVVAGDDRRPVIGYVVPPLHLRPEDRPQPGAEEYVLEQVVQHACPFRGWSASTRWSRVPARRASPGSRNARSHEPTERSLRPQRTPATGLSRVTIQAWPGTCPDKGRDRDLGRPPPGTAGQRTRHGRPSPTSTNCSPGSSPTTTPRPSGSPGRRPRTWTRTTSWRPTRASSRRRGCGGGGAAPSTRRATTRPRRSSTRTRRGTYL